MLLHLSLVIEILSIIVCIHCIYGEKVKLDLLTVVSFLLILILMEIINFYQFDRLYTCISDAVILLYCKLRFMETIWKTFLRMCLFLIVITIMQYVSLLVVSLIMPGQPQLQSVIGSFMVLVICVFFLPKIKVFNFHEIVQGKGKIVFGVICFIVLIIILMIIQEKVLYGIQVEVYIFTVPIIIAFLLFIFKWCKSQDKVDEMQQTIQTMEETKDSYEELLQSIRLRQHGFKNQLAAMFSARYTYDTYENLVAAQKEYYEQIRKENKYNRLLSLGDPILVGFLYKKFHEAEDDNISIEYRVAAHIKNYSVPTYCLIEILGTLFDNAVEAVAESSEDRVIRVEIAESETDYLFYIRNPFRYVSYEELEEWFRLDKSSKGMGRGLGLYHIKQLCDRFSCSICGRNMEDNQKNWIEFYVMIGKADIR